MAEYTATKKIPIKNKVFSFDDIEKIAQIFKKQQDIVDKTNQHVFRYEIYFSDQTSIGTSNATMLADDIIKRPAHPIRVRFYFYCQNKEDNEIYLDTKYKRLSISGNQTWVKEISTSLEEAINAVQTQSSWIKKRPLKPLFISLVAIGIGSLIFLSLNIIFYSILGSYLLWQLTDVLILVIGALLGAYKVYNWLVKLYPIIEFDFGIDYLKIKKARRKRLIIIVSLIVIPSVINIILLQMLPVAKFFSIP